MALIDKALTPSYVSHAARFLLDGRYPVAIAREVPHFLHGWPRWRLA
jgi:hypothetical protein